jgi:hypothetical protein
MLLRHDAFSRLLAQVREARLSIRDVARETGISPFHFIRQKSTPCWMAVLLLTATLLNCGGSGCGTSEYPPDSARPGEAIPIKYEVVTWGGGHQARRVKDISLEYRLVGQEKLTTIKPVLLSRKAPKTNVPNREVFTYVFTIPAYPAGTAGEIEYFTNLTLDGYPNHHEGTKKIKIGN